MGDNRYFNRDLSWLQFNRRVLEEAQDPSTPLLERIKFLSIVSSNLDEFMSVRAAGINEHIKAGVNEKDFSGYAPSGLMKRVMKRVDKLVSDQYDTFFKLMKLLENEGIDYISDYDQLNDDQRKAMDHYFKKSVFPVLTPMAIDQNRLFPLLHTLAVYLAVVLHRDGKQGEQPFFAVVQVPANLPRAVLLPDQSPGRKKQFILLETIIKRHIHMLFPGYQPVAAHAFRLTRNADMTFNEEDPEDLLEEVERELHKRKWGAPIRLEIEEGMHPYAIDMLEEEFADIEDYIFTIEGPIDLSYLMDFAQNVKGFKQLRYRPLKPVYPAQFAEDANMFSVISKQDVLIYHPYESFDPVTEFVMQASRDPAVLAIKMTLYRVSGNSKLVQSLARAAESGKQVTVVVELRARFDEERNIVWAKRLEKAGCHVAYGLAGLKTHAKMLLVVRQEAGGLRRYLHIGTGNYNDATAKVYTDAGLFTSHPLIGEDASELFNIITGYSASRDWKALSVAPGNLRDDLFGLIRREADNARAGKPAKIIAKVNSLSHQDMIDELYEASKAGVKIDLIVRGICCLRPGVPELSENIRVISIVDRFLEHSRFYYFENGGHPEVFLASADWMSRNLLRRIELMCPVFDTRAKQSIIQMLELQLADNVRARQLKPNGVYKRVRTDAPPKRSQFISLDVKSWKVT